MYLVHSIIDLKILIKFFKSNLLVICIIIGTSKRYKKSMFLFNIKLFYCII